ncbi:ATP-citrate synthase alpha chain protein 1-like [Cornus florida]|uniref:ATP-citrate synthase alpha chain protein 1-like n=1 Tax=Cornus florida TaxID=4283 RepID=UPI0028965E06|nr:ATP-citrate synthase alpha chain protein 1-like [Cornus florida]
MYLCSIFTLCKEEMARGKIREYDSKRLLKEHFKRLCGAKTILFLKIHCAFPCLMIPNICHITESTDFNGLVEKEPWLSSGKLVVKPDMLF